MINIINRYIKFLNFDEYLRSNILTFVKAFSEYYGEDKSDEIIDKLSKTLLIGINTPKAEERYIHKIELNTTQDIISNNIEESEILPYKLLFQDLSFEEMKFLPITKYIDFYSRYKLGIEGRRKLFIDTGVEKIGKYVPEFKKEELIDIIRTQVIPDKYKNSVFTNIVSYYMTISNVDREYADLFEQSKKLLNLIDPNITLNNFSTYVENKEIQRLNSIADNFESWKKEYQKRTEMLTEYKNNQVITGQIGKHIAAECFKAYVLENIEFIPADKRELVSNYLQNGKVNNYRLDAYIASIFGYHAGSQTLMDSFSEEATRTLSNTAEPEWVKTKIKQDRIKYFQIHGIDYGNDYVLYLHDAEIEKVWPTSEQLQKMQDSKSFWENKQNVEFFNSLPFNLQIQKNIEEMHLLHSFDSFDARLYSIDVPGTFVNHGLAKTKDSFELYPMLVVRSDDNGAIDHDIVHELNHLYELFLKCVGDNNYTVVSGWDESVEYFGQSSDEIDTLEVERNKRSYELFNEVINEMITQEICQKMRQNNIFVFDERESYRDVNVTWYDSMFFIANEFFSEFKDKIIESRHNGNIQIIWDEVGKENFDQLNELFNIYYENFNGKSTLLNDARKQGLDTPDTRLYDDILKRKDNILNNMRMYSAGQHNLVESSRNTTHHI